MTDIDTAQVVVQPLAGRHPAGGRAARPASTTTVDDPAHAVHGPVDVPVEALEVGLDGQAVVRHLNPAAEVYQALAEEIAGTAVGWSAGALAKLEQGLLQRYGPLVGGRHPVRRLVRLAASPIER